MLAAPRRHYVMRNLSKNIITYTHCPSDSFVQINELYNCLDLYVVASRYEGGPQAIVECAAAQVPIISTNVGLAPEILAQESVFDTLSEYDSSKPNLQFALDNVKKYFMPDGFKPFIDFFENV